MMRSPYRGRYAPDYYPAEQVEQAVHQLKHTAQVWQQRYEDSEQQAQQLHQQVRLLQHEIAAQAELLESQAQPAPVPTPQPEGDIETFVVDVLPVLDNLGRALDYAGDSPLSDGIRLTLREFDAIMARYGIEPIVAQGAVFDPTIHEAIGVMHSADLPIGTVGQVVQVGYRHGNRLLRPARVVVVTESEANHEELL